MIRHIPKNIVKLGIQYDVEPLIDITYGTQLLLHDVQLNSHKLEFIYSIKSNGYGLTGYSPDFISIDFGINGRPTFIGDTIQNFTVQKIQLKQLILTKNN